jgi:hypothetical protein
MGDPIQFLADHPEGDLLATVAGFLVPNVDCPSNLDTRQSMVLTFLGFGAASTLPRSCVKISSFSDYKRA